MEKINFDQLCRSIFCTYGVVLKVTLHCFDQTTGRCILPKTEKKSYSFMCQRCLLEAYVDLGISFCNRVLVITTNTKKIYTE